MVEHHEQGIPLGDQKYGPLRRIRKRYEQYQAGDFLPSVPVEGLNFDRLRR
jgi:hypothetical protein